MSHLDNPNRVIVQRLIEQGWQGKQLRRRALRLGIPEDEAERLARRIFTARRMARLRERRAAQPVQEPAPTSAPPPRRGPLLRPRLPTQT